jgi:hypothetical protein
MYIKKILQYFVLEFVIISVVGLLGYWILQMPVNLPQITLTATISGAIIAFAMITFRKNS